jgi:hypothetical protein
MKIIGECAMRSWQHNIEIVRDSDGNFLVSGDTYEHGITKRTEWRYLIDCKGALVSTITSNKKFYSETILCKCICEYIVKNKLRFLLSPVFDDIVVYQTKENGEFFREI